MKKKLMSIILLTCVVLTGCGSSGSTSASTSDSTSASTSDSTSASTSDSASASTSDSASASASDSEPVSLPDTETESESSIGKQYPDPVAFFNCQYECSDDGEVIVLYGDTDLTEAISEYIELVENCGFTFTNAADTLKDDFTMATGYILAYDNDENSGCITIHYTGFTENSKDANGDYRDYWLLWIEVYNVEDFECVEVDAYEYEDVTENASIGSSESESDDSDDENDSEQQEAETISYNSNSVLLPDIGEFLRCGRGEDMAYRDSGHLISYSFSIDDGRECIDEVIELLQNECYQLSLYNIEDSNYISTSAMLFSFYFFSYNGDNGAIEEVEDGYDVRVLVGYYYGQGRIGLTIYYDSDFEVIDPIVRAENKPTDYSGNPIDGTDTNTWDGTYIAEFAQKDCMICHGTGDCKTCGGDGYLWSSASDKEDRNCWRCQSNVGKCWACNGTGKQQY